MKKIKPRLYAQALATACSQAKSESEIRAIARRFVQLLVQHHQTHDWSRIARLFTNCFGTITQTASPIITSATPLNPNQQQTILDFLTHQYPQLKLLPHFTLDPQLLGGFTILVQDHYYEATLKQQVLSLISSKQ